jgi:hypothetical protein
MTPELAATAPAIPVWRYRLVAGAAELGGSVADRCACNNAVRATRGRRVSCDIDTSRVAFCGTENITTPNLSYAAQYLACALPCECFTSALSTLIPLALGVLASGRFPAAWIIHSSAMSDSLDSFSE